jgi:hypothetical protein
VGTDGNNRTGLNRTTGEATEQENRTTEQQNNRTAEQQNNKT